MIKEQSRVRCPLGIGTVLRCTEDWYEIDIDDGAIRCFNLKDLEEI